MNTKHGQISYRINSQNHLVSTVLLTELISTFETYIEVDT